MFVREDLAREPVDFALAATHLQPDLDGIGVKVRMVSEMVKIHDGPIVVGYELMGIPMKVAERKTAD